MVLASKPDDLQRILDENGNVLPGTKPPALDKAELEHIYRTMMLVRVMDERMLRLQRTGQLGFYMTSTGEEATHMAVSALSENDWIYPSYREPGAAFYRGYTPYEFICQLYGNVDDLVQGRQMPVHHSVKRIHFVSISSPVGTQIPQATGTAMAARIRKTQDVVVSYFGEGTCSEGDFHVGLNFAGVFKAPVIFICRNNRYAISTAETKQTAAKTFASRAIGYGMPGVRVDGNDIFAMIKVTQDAVARARAGKGPTLIEACTYRMGAHSSSDDPSVYRPAQEPDEWQARDPLARFYKYLTKNNLWTEDKDKALREGLNQDIAAATEKARALGAPPLDTLFEDVYEHMPEHLVEQREWLMAQARTKNPHVH